MGAPLYDQIVTPETYGRACRIYAPVGSHEDLLAYLVRRLLENGANVHVVNNIVFESSKKNKDLEMFNLLLEYDTSNNNSNKRITRSMMSTSNKRPKYN